MNKFAIPRKFIFVNILIAKYNLGIKEFNYEYSTNTACI